MNAENIRHLRPFVSVVLLILSLMTLVFLRMEERRLGYSLLKINAEYKKIVDQKRNLEMQLAKASRPQVVDNWAQRKLTLRKLESNQIIHLSGSFGETGEM
jgi:cell division protein FtsL